MEDSATSLTQTAGGARASAGPGPQARGQRLSAAALGGCSAAIAFTLAMSLTANSLALWSDVGASCIDTLAVFIAWLTMRAVRRGNRETFHFGLGRVETLSGFGMGQLMLLTFIVIVAIAVWKFIHPSELHGFGVYLAVGVNAAFGTFNVSVCLRTRRLERERQSPTLAAQRRLYINKVLSNTMFIVAFSAALIASGARWATYLDPAVSLVIAASILLSATKIMGGSALGLVDRSLEEQDQFLILRVLAEHFEDYIALHGVRTRRSGTKRYVELYLEFDPEQRMGEVQDIIDHLKKRISELLDAAEVTVIPSRAAPVAQG
jgi:ferrous-iron efflux pump FieF